MYGRKLALVMTLAVGLQRVSRQTTHDFSAMTQETIQEEHNYQDIPAFSKAPFAIRAVQMSGSCCFDLDLSGLSLALLLLFNLWK